MSQEKSYFYRQCLVFDKDEYSNFTEYFLQILKKNFFQCHEISHNGQRLICISQTNENYFYFEAQKKKLRKIYAPAIKAQNENLEPDVPKQVLYNESRKPFKFDEKELYSPEKINQQIYNIDSKKTDITERWGLDLFTESEMLYLERCILESIEVELDLFVKMCEENSSLKPNIQDYKHDLMVNKSLLHILRKIGVIKDFFPLSVSNFSELITKKTVFSLSCPTDLVRSYYGDKVTLYFAWMSHYQKWLLFPALFGMILYYFASYTGHIKLCFSLFAILVAVWARVYITFWEKQSSEYLIQWDNYDDDEYQKDMLRKEFRGEWKKSKVSGKMEKYFSQNSRNIEYIITFLLSLPLVAFSVFAITIYLNISGGLVGELGDTSMFKYQALSQYAEPGKIFDPESLLGTIVGIIGGILINQIALLFKYVAEYTSNRENHKLKNQYENSIVFKRFIFEFLNNFQALFFLAFILQDLKALKSNLKTMFISNEIRRVITETIIPNIQIAVRGINPFKSSSNRDQYLLNSKIDEKLVIHEFESDKFDSFDDYIEIISEFGYIVLFADCYPTAAFLVFVINFIEIRSDITRLATCFRRPFVHRKKTIGSWNWVLHILSIMAVFTNLLLFINSSHKDFKDLLEGDQPKLLKAMPDNKLSVFMFYEHLILISFLLMKIFLKNTTYWTRLFLERRQWRIKNEVDYEK